MEEHELIELRSDEVQEILGTPPSWLVRWGTTVIVSIIVAMLALAYFVKYPDIIRASMIITTSQPPTSIVSRADGNIAKLYISEKQKVKTGDVLGLLQNSANYEDVKALDATILKLQSKELSEIAKADVSKNLLVGELQAPYSALVQALDIYKFTNDNRYADVNSGQLKGQITRLEREYKQLQERLRITKTDKFTIAKDYAERQGKLFTEKVISLNELQTANERFAEIKNEISGLESLLINKEVEIASMRSRILEIQQGAKQGSADQLIKIKEAITATRAALDQWKQTFVLTAAVDGKVTFFNRFWKEQQFVKAGEEILAIVPEEEKAAQKIIAKVTIPVEGAGKVKENQRVVMQLASYPYEQFGIVEGKVEAISLVPKDNAYMIQVAIEGEKLKTNYGREIPQAQQLPGEAQIITEDRRFLQRIFDKAFAAVKKY